MSAEIYSPPPVVTKEHHPSGHNGNGQKARNGGPDMHRLAAEELQHYLASLPKAHAPQTNPFPHSIWWGLGVGIVVGAILGVIFGLLLLRDLVVMPGWEGLYSMAPGAFIAFWLFAGTALGMIVGGVGAILWTPIPQAAAPGAGETSLHPTGDDGQDA